MLESLLVTVIWTANVSPAGNPVNPVVTRSVDALPATGRSAVVIAYELSSDHTSK